MKEKLLLAAAALLGFATACENKRTVDMYGTPYFDYKVSGRKKKLPDVRVKGKRQRLFRREGLEEEIGKKIRFDKGRCLPDDPDVYAADPGRKCISTAVFCCGYDHRGTYPWF